MPVFKAKVIAVVASVATVCGLLGAVYNAKCEYEQRMLNRTLHALAKGPNSNEFEEMSRLNQPSGMIVKIMVVDPMSVWSMFQGMIELDRPTYYVCHGVKSYVKRCQDMGYNCDRVKRYRYYPVYENGAVDIRHSIGVSDGDPMRDIPDGSCILHVDRNFEYRSGKGWLTIFDDGPDALVPRT